MRPAIYKCPNHLSCTVAYHGDDVEIHGDAPLVCPECGTALEPLRRHRPPMMPIVINVVLLGCIALGVWLAWPTAVKYWKKLTTPVGEQRK